MSSPRPGRPPAPPPQPRIRPRGPPSFHPPRSKHAKVCTVSPHRPRSIQGERRMLSTPPDGQSDVGIANRPDMASHSDDVRGAHPCRRPPHVGCGSSRGRRRQWGGGDRRAFRDPRTAHDPSAAIRIAAAVVRAVHFPPDPPEDAGVQSWHVVGVCLVK